MFVDAQCSTRRCESSGRRYGWWRTTWRGRRAGRVLIAEGPPTQKRDDSCPSVGRVRPRDPSAAFDSDELERARACVAGVLRLDPRETSKRPPRESFLFRHLQLRDRTAVFPPQTVNPSAASSDFLERRGTRSF